MAPVMMDQLPVIKKVFKWFKGDGLVIDNPLFKLHHQVSTLVLLVGFIYISVENHLDESILCQAPPSISAYAKSYCWIHGTAYVRQHLQGKATGCTVDQSRIQSEEDAPITAYYLWLPYLLTFCMLFAKFPHSMWKNFFENGLMQAILEGRGQDQSQGQDTDQGTDMSLFDCEVQGQGQNQGKGKNKGNQGSDQDQWKGQGQGQGQNQGKGKNSNKGNKGKGGRNQSNATTVAQNFIKFRPRYSSYYQRFCMWETINILMVILSWYLTHWLLNYKFLYYGLEVTSYIGSNKIIEPRGLTHNPMCELFPTEVACTFRIGASTGGIDRSNFLCILGNNLFNQKYFFILWLWWIFLLIVSAIGLVYRLATASLPSFARTRLDRRIHGGVLRRMTLSSAECFVLDIIMDNMSSRQAGLGGLDQLLEALQKLEGNKITELENYKPLTKNGDHMSETSLTESDTRLQIVSEGYPNGYIPIKSTNPL